MGHQEAANPDVDHTKPKWTLTIFLVSRASIPAAVPSIEVRLLSERPKAKTLDNRPKWQVIYHIQPFLAVLFKHGSGLEMLLLPSSKRRLNISPAAAVVFLRFFHPIWNGKMALLLNFLWCHLGGPHLSSNAKNGGFCDDEIYKER